MKKLFFLLLVIFLSANFAKTFGYDTTTAKYFPLQNGNTWVYYSHSWGNSYDNTRYNSYKITGTLDTLGKRYYVFETRSVFIGGFGNTSCGAGLSHIRIDSLTMNLYTGAFGCGGFYLLDSLNSRLNDHAVYCGGTITCIDTLVRSYFGLNYPTKRFNNPIGAAGEIITYAMGLGITTRIYGGNLMDHCDNTLTGCVINGILHGDTSMIVGINVLSTEIPNSFFLYQNYPNPFNPSTSIKFDIPKAGIVSLKIYDIAGKEIYSINDFKAAGQYEFTFDASNYASGLYFYKLESGTFTETKKMVLIK